LDILVPCFAKLHLVGLGQSLVVIDVVFFVAGLPSIVSAHLGFQDRVFGDLASMFFFIARGWLHVFFSVCALYAWKVVYGLKLKLWFLGGWLPFFPTHVVYLLLMHPLSFLVLRWHERFVYACLVCEFYV
ncbi:hypothetical protein HID58_059619, partial [Brassica napus]